MTEPRRGDVHVGSLPNRRHAVRSYLIANTFEWALAGQALLTAIVFFTHPHDPNTAVAATGETLGYVWNILYTAGALAIVAGMLCLSPRVEASGLVLLVAALTVNVVAVALYVPSWTLFVLYAIIVLACFLRVRLLAKLMRILADAP